MAATLRSFGIRFGYYNPKSWQEARYIDPIVETFSDVVSSVGKTAFAPDDQKAACMEALIALVTKFIKLAESNLVHHGGKFIAGNKVTIADFVMIAYVENLLMNKDSPFSAPL